jgi:hypothetical protein
MCIIGFGFRLPKQSNPDRSLAGAVVAAGTDVTKPSPETTSTALVTAPSPSMPALKRDSLPEAGKPRLRASGGDPRLGITALQALRDRAQVQPREEVLIIGDSGGVGTFAVQIA